MSHRTYPHPDQALIQLDDAARVLQAAGLRVHVTWRTGDVVWRCPSVAARAAEIATDVSHAALVADDADAWLRLALEGRLRITGSLEAALEAALLLLTMCGTSATRAAAADAARCPDDGFPLILTPARRDQMLWAAYAIRRVPEGARNPLLSVAINSASSVGNEVVGDLLTGLADWAVGNHVPASDEASP